MFKTKASSWMFSCPDCVQQQVKTKRSSVPTGMKIKQTLILFSDCRNDSYWSGEKFIVPEPNEESLVWENAPLFYYITNIKQNTED